MKLLYVTLITSSIVALSACWNESSSDDSPAPAPEPETVDECEPQFRTSGDPTSLYDVENYSSCDASDLSMTGLWLIISDYWTTTDTYDVQQQQRMTMVIGENNAGHLNASICNRDQTLRNFPLSAGDSELIIHDQYARADVSLSIVNNVLMQGEHLSSAETIVQRSTVTAVKIDDAARIGWLDLDFTLDGYTSSERNLNVECFAQRSGRLEIIPYSIHFEGESAVFVTTVDNNGTDEELLASTFTPVDPNREIEVNLHFFPSGSEIEGEETGNTSVTYLENTNSSVILAADVIDDGSPNDFASFELRISL
ncbi:hypothetical protein ACXYTJ_10260 [Gilvimarinus sp. F26214L]|uniref:hypothetical protein n=1 Tax=Gilvimarinus sp. DZF01 TaxID=3461371 RepID=UPI004045CDAF